MIEPLVDAGLPVSEIRALLLRLSFDAIVADGEITAAGIDAVVSDQPPHAQLGWAMVLHRLSMVEETS